MTASEMLLRINTGDGRQRGRKEREQETRRAIRTLLTILRRKPAKGKKDYEMRVQIIRYLTDVGSDGNER